VVLGVLFVAYWALLPRRRLISQMARIQADREGKQWSFMSERRDVRFTALVGVVTLALIVAGVVYAQAKWPGTIPLQVRNARPCAPARECQRHDRPSVKRKTDAGRTAP
jgi:hypothetical protein